MRHKRVRILGATLILAGLLVGINAFAQIMGYSQQVCWASDAGSGMCWCWGIPACAGGIIDDPDVFCLPLDTKRNCICYCYPGDYQILSFEDCDTVRRP